MWYIRQVMYKEPFDGPLPWINLGVGCFSILAGLFGIFLRGPASLLGPMILAQGLTFVCWGVSDLLPPEHRWAISALRVGFMVFQSAVFVLLLATLLQGLGS